MKEWLKKQIKAKEEARSALKEKAKKSESVEEVRSIGVQIEALDAEITDFRTQLDAIPDEAPPATATPPAGVAERTAVVNGQIPGVVVSNANSQQGRKEALQGVDSTEYRSAFLKALQGKPLNEAETREYSLVPNTGGAVVPTQTANMIFDNMTKIAPMLDEIQLLRVAGGLRFAVEGVRLPAAPHVENAPVIPAADTMVTVTLTGFEFIKVIRISQTIQTMAIDIFESWLAKIIGEDLAVQIDNQIINGGTVAGNIAAAQIWVDGVNQVTYVPANGLVYSDLTNLIALLPSAFDRNAKFVMRKSTFYQQVLGMEDANGKPIVVQDVAGAGKFSILGYPVLIDDNVLANEAYLGDYKQVVGNLAADIQIARSTESGFLNNSVDFRGTAIFDCDIAQPTAIVKLNV